VSHRENCETKAERGTENFVLSYESLLTLKRTEPAVQSRTDFNQAAHFTALTDFKRRNRRTRPVLKSDYGRHEISIRAEVSASVTQGLYTRCQKVKLFMQSLKWQKAPF
jgi:hypothetical protein